MSEVEQKHTPTDNNNDTHDVVHDFEVLEIPPALKELQELTKISDQHVQKLIKTYKDELITSPLLLGLEAYYAEIKDTKSVENLIDKVSEKKYTHTELVDIIVEDCLIVRGAKKELNELRSSIDYINKQNELYDKIQELKSKTFEKIPLDHNSRNTALESIADPHSKIVTTYISAKDIPLPEIETMAKTSSYAQDPKYKDLPIRQLIEQTDKVPGAIIKDLKLDVTQAKIIKELNYKTLIQIVRTNPKAINQNLIIEAIKHEKSTDKLQDKLIEKNTLVPNARTKYGSKIAKAVVNYSIQKVFGNGFLNLKKSTASKEIKTELDVVNILTNYMTSGQIDKDPKSIIATNQKHTDNRAVLKDKAESSSVETAKKQNDQDIEDLKRQLAEVIDHKEQIEDQELTDIIATIDGITGGFDVDKVDSKKAQKNKQTGTTLCSRTACININNILEVFDKDNDENVLKGDASSLIKDLIKSQTADIIRPTSFTDPTQIEDITKYFKNKALESQGNVFDVYFFSPKKHRSVIFLSSDGNLYALDPYHGGGGTTKPVPLEQLLKNLAPKVQSTNIVVNNIVYAQISDASQKKLADAYEKIQDNVSLQAKLEDHYGDPDIVYKLSKYNDKVPYHDENVVDLPQDEPIIIEQPKSSPIEIIKEDFTIEMLKLHVPKIYGGITYEDLFTAITNISDPSLKTNCIQKIKAEKIMDFQLLLGMLKDAPLDNRADGKIGQYTLAKVKEKINVATASNK